MTGTEIAASVLLLGGALLAVLAGVGMVRLPDVGSRLQAATKLQVIGLVVLAAGAALLVPVSEVLKLALVVLFQLATAPVLAQLVAREAHRAGVGKPLVRDELRNGEGPGAPPPR
ncbi:monovalent cation/H(+) antiporter subunit G [Modestobacter lapidis]|nr:monovalent cation/H(+) antiporter subunit G [Modestobacter lapidis]